MRNHILLLFILFVFNLNAQDKGWNIRTTDVNADYTGIAIANGRIGMLSSKAPFQIKHIVLNNVYDVDPNLEVSQILHGMNFGNLDVYIDNEKITQNNISNWQQNMNMKEAAFTTSFQFEDKNKKT